MPMAHAARTRSHGTAPPSARQQPTRPLRCRRPLACGLRRRRARSARGRCRRARRHRQAARRDQLRQPDPGDPRRRRRAARRLGRPGARGGAAPRPAGRTGAPSTRPAAVVEAVKARQVDLAFVAIDPVRAADMDYTAPYVIIEGAYLVRNDSPLQRNEDVDRAGTRVVVGPRQRLRPVPHARAEGGDAGAGADLARGHRPLPGAEPRSRGRREAAARGRRAARRRRAPAARAASW